MVGPEAMAVSSEEILSFWFGDPPRDGDDSKGLMKKWFGANAEIDAAIRSQFEFVMGAAARDELRSWSESPRGRLAMILLLDQFPRNIHRGDRAAFNQDERALALTMDGMAKRLDQPLSPLERMFFYMPMQHSESLAVQRRAVETFEQLAHSDTAAHVKTTLEGAAEYARLHHDIVARFGRFPHRNAVLGRESTPAERRYLEEGAPTFGQ
jgi:uncharacterized protein (DUF924 family)